MKALAPIALLCGCSQLFGLEPPARRDTTMADAAGDASSNGMDAMLDSSADARVCPSAPTGCVAFQCAGSSSCYYHCGRTAAAKKSYANAKAECVTASLGCLVTVNTQAENDCISTNTNPSFPDALVWLGYEQASSGTEPAGGWSWACGASSYTAPNWGMQEPNDLAASEDCGFMLAAGAWADGDCSGTATYVCELP